jgi:hypothetical protein
MLGVEAHGFLTHPLFSQRVWDPAGIRHLGRYGGWFVLLAVPILTMAPWAFAPFVAGLATGLTLLAVGPRPVLAVLLFLLSAHVLGRRLLGASGACAVLLGTAVFLLLMNGVGRVPVNDGWSWGVILSLPVLAEGRNAWRSVGSMVAWIRSTEWRSVPARLSVAALAFVLGMHWLIAPKPEKSADGLAMHLAIPANVQAHHAMTFTPERFVWSVMPLNGDWAYTMVYLVGGEFAARLLNLAFFLVALALLDGMLQPLLQPAMRLLFLLLFATTPLVQLVTGSLFVENLLAALILGMMTALWRFAEGGELRWFYAAMALGGTALATKLGALSFVAGAAPFAFFALRRRGGPRARRAAAGTALFLLCASPPYAIAWWKTGNPVFPFLNEKIHSPLLDSTAQFRDNEFRMPLRWRTPYELTFETHRYYEAQDGAFGFHYLLLAPLALLAADRRSRMAAAVGLGAAVLTLRMEPNARFLYAALPLILVGAAGALSRVNRGAYRALAGCLALCAALNIWFLPASGWYHKDFYMQGLFRRGASTRYLQQEAPVRDVAQHFERAHPGAAIFQTGEIDAADVTGEVYENHWHQYGTWMAIRQAAGPRDLQRMFARWNARYFLSPVPSAAEPIEPPALGQFLQQCTVREYGSGRIELRRLETSQCQSPGK